MLLLPVTSCPFLLYEEPILQQDPGLSGRKMDVSLHTAVRRTVGAWRMFGISFFSPSACIHYILKIAGQEYKSPVKNLSDLKGSKAKHEY